MNARYLLIPIVKAVIMSVMLTTTAPAVDLTFQKLFGKWSVLPTDYQTGNSRNSAAMSSKWIVMGVPNASERGQLNEGAVQIFNASNGSFSRKLLPPGAATASQFYGVSVAIYGDLLVVGSSGTSTYRGRAYLYNLTTGKLLKTLSAADAADNDLFGYNVSTNGDVVAVSAIGDDSNRGSVYLYNAMTGAQIAKIQASDGVAGHYFGYGLAMEGAILAVGADSADAGRGAVYFYNATTQTQIKKYQPAAWLAGNEYGSTLCMHQGRVVIGSFGSGLAWLHDLAENTESSITLAGTGSSFGKTVSIHGSLLAVGEMDSSAGKVHLFDSRSGTFIQTLVPPNGETNTIQLGYAISLEGNTLLALAPSDDVQATNAGCGFIFKPLIRPMEYVTVVKKGDSAPSVADISYEKLGDVCINSTNAIIFNSSLMGANSGKGKDVGVFSDITTTGAQKLFFKTRQVFTGSALFNKPSRISFNDAELAVGLSSLVGTGVNSTNNQLLWARTNTDTLTIMRSGAAFTTTSLSGSKLKKVSEVVTSNQLNNKQMAAAVSLIVGQGGTTADTDSALYFSRVGTSEEAVRENDNAVPPLSASTKLGEIAPRIAYNYVQQVYSTALRGPDISSAYNAAVFKRSYGAAAVLVAQKGDLALDGAGTSIPNVRYSAFIGESANGDNGAVYRATLSGSSSSANEGVWVLRGVGGPPTKYAAVRKGDQVTSLPGTVKIARIVNFWGMGSSSESQVIILVQLSGTGVNAANDMALMLSQGPSSSIVLMREGDPAPGCPGARIGVISRVDADAWSNSYAVLATLTGASSSSNLALFTGNVMRGNETTRSVLRRPFLRLRKGQLFENQPGRVKSISLHNTNVTPSGAGGTGRGRGISWNGNLAFIVEFENGIRQIVKGTVN